MSETNTSVEAGKRLRIWRTNFTRRKDAEGELTRLLQEREVKPIPKTFGEFMVEWFAEHAERHCSPKTTEG